MRSVIFVASLLCTVIPEAMAQEVVVAPAKLLPVPVTSSSVVYLTRGPRRYLDTAPEGTPTPPPGADWSAGEFYRVSLLVSEVYYDLAVERYVFWGPEGGHTKLSWNARVAGSDLAKHAIGRQHLVDLEFVEWTSADTFILAEGGSRFEVQVQANGHLVVRPQPSGADGGSQNE